MKNEKFRYRMVILHSSFNKFDIFKHFKTPIHMAIFNPHGSSPFSILHSPFSKFSILNLISLLLISMASCQPVKGQSKKISILGDSYSTFHGYLTPDTNLCWYGQEERKNNVKTVEETWWYPLVNKPGYQLELNNSYSGATVCNTGYRKEDYSDRSFITRMDNLGAPDIIFVFGGTNDNWAGAPIGEFQYADWSKETLYSFRPAFAYMLNYLTTRYPEATIYNIVNSDLKDEVTGSMEEICRHYGITNIVLHDIEKQSGHPSINGMASIGRQVWEVVEGEKLKAGN